MRHPLLPAGFLAVLSICVPTSLVAQDEASNDDELRALREEIRALAGEVRGLREALGDDVPVDEFRGGTDATFRFAGWDRHREMVSSSPYQELGWQFVGPTNLSGRVTDLDVVAPRGESYTMIAATASGGLWRTDNEGVTWEPIFENEITAAFGDVTLDPNDPDTIWVGTGEQNIFRSSNAGAGLWRSTDGGDTWEHKGLADTHTIARIVVHPHDSNTIYVAASGREWTHNPERGVYRSKDGGDTWESILFIDDETAALDLVLDESKPEILYATTWQRIRKRWNDPRNDENTSGSGVWRSLDGGDSWHPINDGLPIPAYRGRIGIDIARSNPSVLYAFVDNYERLPLEEEGLDSYGRPLQGRIKGSEVYRTDDRGETWRKVSEDSDRVARIGSTYGWVFGQIRVDPTNEDKIYVMGVQLHMSEDGGQSYRVLRGMHADHHALWIDPRNPDYVVNGNDGGVVVTYDGGENWRQFLDNLPAVQFFDIEVDNGDPFKVYGSVQDHGSFSGEINVGRRRDRIRPVDFDRAPGWEGSDHQIDPTDPDIVYAAGFYGSIYRTDLRTNERTQIMPKAPEGEPPLRGQWVAPFLLSPHNPRVLYHGMNKLFRSMDRGDVFHAISPDLSYNDVEKIGDIQYQTITTITESWHTFGELYAGTDDGRFHKTPDSGATWIELTDQLAPDRWISRAVASRHADGTVYVAQNGKRNDDFTPYLWRTDDGGESFVDIAGGIPLGPINAIVEDPEVPGLVYVGTDIGVYVTWDHGATWDALVTDLPTTYVHDLDIQEREDFLVAGTHGRGVWVLDLRPLREPEAEEEEAEESEGSERRGRRER